ncbi:MAG: hypothetical protein LUG18_11410 [Candidatus Azobacteroides sp.]|nr:hypothetical protein [Candidatus Azobacteroides sp.]
MIKSTSMGYKIIILGGVLLCATCLGYAGHGEGGSLPAASFSFGVGTGLSPGKGDIQADEDAAYGQGLVVWEKASLFPFDKDEDPSASAPPPGGGRPQKVPLQGKEILLWLFLSIAAIIIYKKKHFIS